MNVFIVGPMGAGKTTVGKLLAQELGLEFRDSDHEIELRAGTNISWIFDIEGEDGFRTREAKIIDDMTQESGIVLATGGGAVLDEQSRRHMSARGTVVYLRAPLELQLERTKFDRDRPLLQVEDREAKLKELMEERDPVYLEVADLVIDTDQKSSKKIVKEIVGLLS